VAGQIMLSESSSDILVTLLLCGLMGMLGQGIRAAIGLRKAFSPRPGTPRSTDGGTAAARTDFSPSYFATSLMIGFIAGDLAGVWIGLDKLMHFNADNMNVLISISAAGYAGVDFIENTFSKLIPHGVQASWSEQDAAGTEPRRELPSSLTEKLVLQPRIKTGSAAPLQKMMWSSASGWQLSSNSFWSGPDPHLAPSAAITRKSGKRTKAMLEMEHHTRRMEAIAEQVYTNRLMKGTRTTGNTRHFHDFQHSSYILNVNFPRLSESDAGDCKQRNPS